MSLFGFLNWHYLCVREDGPISRPAYAELATKLFLDGARVLLAEAVPIGCSLRAPPSPMSFPASPKPTGSFRQGPPTQPRCRSCSLRRQVSG